MAVKKAMNLAGRELKESTRELHRAVGTLADAERVTGKSSSQHGNYHSQDASDFATIDDVARLEAVAERSTAWPQVTRKLCELAGGVYVPLPDVQAHSGPMALTFVALVREFGELAAAAHDGLADNSLEPEELLRLKREGSDMQALLAGFLRQVDDMIAAAPPSVADLRRARER